MNPSKNHSDKDSGPHQPASDWTETRHPAVRDFFFAYQWHILALLALIAAILGCYGFFLTTHPTSFIEYAKLIYLTAQLFVLESNLAPNQGLFLPLVTAQILAPLVFGFAAWKTVATVFREQFRLFGLAFRRNHVVIVGLGAKGIRLVKEYHRRDDKVAVIEPDAKNDDVPVCLHYGAAVLIGNGADSSMLERARVHAARIIFAVTGDDGINVEIAVKAHRLVAAKPCAPMVRCYVHITDANLRALFKRRGMISDVTDRFDARVININDIGARLLMLEYPLDYRSVAPDKNAQPHLVIAGFGGMGESLALEAAKIGHFANGKSVRITVLDRDAPRKESLILARYPQLRRAVSIDFIQTEIGSRECFETIRQLTRENGAQVSVAVCIHDTTGALSYALSLNARLEKIPIYVRLDTTAGAALLLKERRNVGREVIAFGMLDRSCLPEIIENETLDTTARAIHEAYIAHRTGVSPGDPSMLPWERLDSSFKESSRSQADHIPVKMRGIGCRIVKKQAAGEPESGFEGEELEVLSRMEHARWMAERFLEDWRYGEDRDALRKISPYLVPWDRLPPDIRKYDGDAVNEIPRLLDRIGLKIVRDVPPGPF